MGLDCFFLKHTNLGYFRKVNFLVSFFELYGFDVERQTPLYITKDTIEDLRNRCVIVLNDNTLAEKLLPTCSGYFFGNTDYNDHYYSDVKEVLIYIENTLLPILDNLKEKEGIYFETWY